jgi:hypothetical protein
MDYTNLLRVGDLFLFGRNRRKFVLEDGDDSIGHCGGQR